VKLTRLLLRWYKSFHFNHRGLHEKGEVSSSRPWNQLYAPTAPNVEYQFIEIPIEKDITTIVGANESGKSHLLNAISKVVQGSGLGDSQAFSKTDLCHYASIRTQNSDAWPNIGLQFDSLVPEERDIVVRALNTKPRELDVSDFQTFTLILAPDESELKPALIFLDGIAEPFRLSEENLGKIRACLPTVQFIDSRAILASELSLTRLLQEYGEKGLPEIDLGIRQKVAEAIQLLGSLPIPGANQAITEQ
jgi:energy-coupling factor transporter ATP-binding protein EcfA2